MAQPTTLVNLPAELWLANRLKQHGPDVFQGLTTREDRMQRIRSAITSNQLSSVVVGKKDGKPETYAECFQRLYGEPL